MTKLSGAISDDDEEMLTSYIDVNMDNTWAIDKLKGAIPKELARVCLRCSGEKHRYSNSTNI